MTFPEKNEAHLDADFPAWVSLVVDLIVLGRKDERFVILDGETTAEALIQQLVDAKPLYADLRASDAMGGHSLSIVYQRGVPERERYLQLASGRFMLEISLDDSLALRDVFLSLADSESAGMPYGLKPLTNDRGAMLAFLADGRTIGYVEVE